MDFDNLFAKKDCELEFAAGVTAHSKIVWFIQRGRAKAYYAYLVTLKPTDKIAQGDLVIAHDQIEIPQTAILAQEKIADPKTWIADRMIISTYLLNVSGELNSVEL